jgi:hypothetical protein
MTAHARASQAAPFTAATDRSRGCVTGPIAQPAAADAWKKRFRSHRNRHERFQTSYRTRCSIGSWMYTCSRPASKEPCSTDWLYEAHGFAVCTQEMASNCPAGRSADCSSRSVLSHRAHSHCNNRNEESSRRPHPRRFPNSTGPGARQRNILTSRRRWSELIAADSTQRRGPDGFVGIPGLDDTIPP